MNKIYYSRLHLPDVSRAESEIIQLFPMSDDYQIQDSSSNGSVELSRGTALDQCYKREVIPKCISGNVLMYRLNACRTGTPIDTGKVRYTRMTLYKRNSDIHNLNTENTRELYSGKPERFMGELEPDQLETLGFPPRDSDKWKSSGFCEAIQSRYYWTTLNLQKYIQMPAEPGPVPQFWHFTNYTIDGEDPQSLRASLFEKLLSLGVHIEVKNSNWKYNLYFTDGPHYLEIDLHFFKQDPRHYTAELNQLSGDRWSFANIWRRINDKKELLPRHRSYWPEKTPKYIQKALVEQSIDESMIMDIGEDQPPDVFISFMRCNDLNIVRVAMERYNSTDISPVLSAWAGIAPRNFLEKKITERAQKLCELSSRL